MDNELYHHGVKGMKWGVRNGPPYPLNNTSKRSKKVGETSVKKTNISNITNETIKSYIRSGKIQVDKLKNYNVGSLTIFENSGKEYISGLIHGHDFDWQEVTNSSKHGLKPVSELADLNYKETGSYGKYQFADSDPIYERSIKHGRVDDYSLQKCNPTFGDPGTVQNCAKCSATLELASRGLNFSAGRQTYPSSVDAESHWFKGAKRLHMDTDITEESIKSFGNKTSGSLSIQYPGNSGGHAMHWTVDDEGSFEIQDGQNGRRFSSLSQMMDTYGADKSKGLDVFRLDNCEPDWEHMASDSVIRDPDGSDKGYNKVLNRFTNKLVDTW